MKKAIVVILLLSLFVGGGYVFYLYNKKTPTLNNATADFTLTANELFDAFDTNETEALSKYSEKIIAVTGEVADIKESTEKYNIILKADNAMIGGINCAFTEKQKNITIGKSVTIKGRCQGFLMNVVLNNCFLEKY